VTNCAQWGVAVGCLVLPGTAAYTGAMGETSNRDWIKPFLRRLAPVFREVFAMSFFVNLLALAVPVFTLQVYDRVVGQGGLVTLVGLAIGMVVIVLFDFVLRQARSRIMQTVALRVDAIVGRQLFNKFTALPLNVLESRSGNYWQALFRDVDDASFVWGAYRFNGAWCFGSSATGTGCACGRATPSAPGVGSAPGSKSLFVLSVSARAMGGRFRANAPRAGSGSRARPRSRRPCVPIARRDCDPW